MNIAILTQPLLHNYGGTLQNFALQQVIKGLGHEVCTVNWGISNSIVKWFAHYCINMVTGRSKPENPRTAVLRDRNFIEFHRQFISTTKPMGLIKPEQLKSNDFNAYIVGSDQVWRKDYNPSIDYMFLSFVPNEAIRIAYAASYGKDEWDYPSELTQRCKHNAERFNLITVREQSAINLLKNHLGVNSSLVLDPTMLLDVADYERILNLKKKERSKKIVAYLLDLTDEKKELLSRISSELDLQIELIGNSRLKDNFSTREEVQYPSVQEWLEKIRDAEYVITDSFHGTAFAINFNKPFITLGNENRGNTRFESLLTLFGLQERIINKSDCLQETIETLKAKVNWVKVNEIKTDKKIYSIDLLKNNLR